jgi:uncharacterized protein (DUF2235 family)
VNVILTDVLTAAMFGTFLGSIFGPLRLAGVDYSKWYRNPGEISESNDRTWIGLMKWTALATGRRLLALVVIVEVIALVLRLFANWMPAYVLSAADRVYLLGYFWPWSWRGVGFSICILIGLLAGVGLVQSLLEMSWRLGLRFGPGRSLEIRLARRAPVRPQAAAVSPVAGRRRLIICCDGTWNWPVPGRETNVVQFLRAIKPVGHDRHGAAISQIAYYHLGVGTGNLVDHYFGGGAGIGLSSSVKACYGFLVDNYRDGDEVLLFGFSRGAYVARSVAGMIGLIGLLEKEEMFRFLEAWDYYTLPAIKRNVQDLQTIAPKRRFPLEITCIGVWDTVGALGIPGTRLCSSTYAFHDTSLGEHVRYALQGLSMDEQRGNFQPAVWVKQFDDQVLEQVWFPGVHSDIGGGYVEHGLSDAALLWMLHRLDAHRLVDFNIGCVELGIKRHHAQKYAEGFVHASRSIFFTAIACAIPRPVGITDESEMIHQSAIARRPGIGQQDPYARASRQKWLESLAASKIARTSRFEIDHAFQGAGHGNVVKAVIYPSRGLCDRFLRWLFGEA